MILSELKLKLAGRFLHPGNQVKRQFSGTGSIYDITVVLDSLDPELLELFSGIRHIYGLKKADFSIITCAESTTGEKEGFDFSVSDLSWSGKFRKQQLQEFFSRSHNIVIAFSRHSGTSFKFLLQNCKADLKIGRSEKATGLYDLEIFSRYEEADVFIKEIDKYLKILKYRS